MVNEIENEDQNKMKFGIKNKKRSFDKTHK